MKLEKAYLEEILYRNKKSIIVFLLGSAILGFGIFSLKLAPLEEQSVEILETSETLSEGQIAVEVSGAVNSPGVYYFMQDQRVEDALVAAGWLRDDADTMWVEKYLNRAAKLTDGQKIYIPVAGEQSSGSSASNIQGYQGVAEYESSGQNKYVNINTASQKELESLWGIGPVYAQNIIDHRPYSSVEELLSKGVIKSNVYERNKDLLSVY